MNEERHMALRRFMDDLLHCSDLTSMERRLIADVLECLDAIAEMRRELERAQHEGEIVWPKRELGNPMVAVDKDVFDKLKADNERLRAENEAHQLRVQMAYDFPTHSTTHPMDRVHNALHALDAEEKENQ